ncbi:putative dihydrodipicolinate synthase [Colletotrichum godetiae]|uniref:Dihydrodipicolinate synthase n=1 Tax=Colletotrichum godetiae TaxID=1209918 RepID=A0AAJ0AL15_9PEZI|nr:putative dihydrodipicolinate synthase [Colletotrichum godetiae]KAK1675858.1 putative dihydrodipicolinate synthase [Colletotrichum godetiae]
MGLILNPGAYGPLPTFFNEKQEIDYESYEKHLLNLARRGINPVCAGSLGEAVHLSPEERVDLIKFIRRTLDDAGLTDMPIVAGVGGSSTRETVKLAHAAGNAGADAGLVILPAYYAASLSTDQDQIIQYYVDICKESPIPLFLYNFPANAGGLDMSSAVIEAVIRQAPNLCGAKLTCGGSVSKLVRLSSFINSEPSVNTSRPYPFLLLDGLISDLTPWMKSGGHGTVSGIPNFAPAASMRLWALLIKPNLTEDERQEADRIQYILSNADVAAVPAGVRGMKYVLHKLHGYGIDPRRPLLKLGEAEGERLMSQFEEMIQLEAKYSKTA